MLLLAILSLATPPAGAGDLFWVPDTPKPLLLGLHPWNGRAATFLVNHEIGGRPAIEVLAEEYFVVVPDMGGYGDTPGTPDASGFELLDALAALEFADRAWPDKIDWSRGPYLLGGSGGGGNVLALVGKAPYRFAAAVSICGISDYALWWEQGTLDGQFRPTLEAWIGGTPETNPEGYRSRGGINLVENLATPVLLQHGSWDDVVPVIHSVAYHERAQGLGKDVTLEVFPGGHGKTKWDSVLAFLRNHATPPLMLRAGRLRVHSFLSLPSGDTILADPYEMGRYRYWLSSDDRLVKSRYRAYRARGRR